MRLVTTSALALFLAAPAAFAQPLDCPEPAPVFSAAGAAPIDLDALSSEMAAADLGADDLDAVIKRIRTDYPSASDAEVADIAITAFCRHVQTHFPADRRSEAPVAAFEAKVYDAVFGGAPPETYARQGWLYGN